MKRFLIAAAVIVTGISTPLLAADVGVSVNVGEPGFYGRIDIGDSPQPRVIYAQPRVVEHVDVVREPVYLRVPPGHRKHWSQHCQEYNACGERVYFVQDDWYNREYAPRYRERHGGGREDRHEDHHGDHDDHDRGHGNGHGHGRD